jgi:hypothetical protein
MLPERSSIISLDCFATMNRPPLRKCVCGSWYCGVVCRFFLDTKPVLLREVKRGSEDRPLESIKEEGK